MSYKLKLLTVDERKDMMMSMSTKSGFLKKIMIWCDKNTCDVKVIQSRCRSWKGGNKSYRLQDIKRFNG